MEFFNCQDFFFNLNIQQGGWQSNVHILGDTEPFWWQQDNVYQKLLQENPSQLSNT